MNDDKRNENMRNINSHKIISFINSGNKLVASTKEAPLVDSNTQDENSLDTSLYIASSIVDKIVDDIIYIDNLTPYYINLLSYYFYKTRMVVSRSVKLKSKIPLSAMNVIRPDVKNPIVQEAVYSWYNKVLNKINFKNVMYKVLLSMNLYGRGYLLIQTDHSYESNSYQNMEALHAEISDEDMDKIKDITDRYSNDFSSVSKKEINFVLDKLMPLRNNFSGIISAKHIDILDISEERENSDINYYEISLPISSIISSQYHDYIKGKYGEEGVKEQFVEFMGKLGYSRSYVSMCYDSLVSGNSEVTISSDITEDCFIIKFSNDDIGDSNSPILSVLKDLIDNEIKKRKNKKVNVVADKNVKIITSESASPDDLELLLADVTNAVQNADYSALVTNYDVSINELDFSIKDQNSDEGDSPKDDILAGLGMPQSLVDASETYGSGFIQIQTLNTELQEIANSFEYQIVNLLFHALSYKKGFVTLDMFNNTTTITPNVNLYKGGVMFDDYIEKVMDMASDNLIPKRYIFENIMGLDYEKVMQDLKSEKEYTESLGI